MNERPDRWLDGLQIASPCKADWSQMRGDERRRHCDLCQLDVYNLSAMTRNQAAALVQQHTGKRLCVRFLRREDGTVLTRDCPVGWRQRARRAWARAAALFGALTGLLGMPLAGCTGRELRPAPAPVAPPQPPQPQPQVMGEFAGEMGDFRPPSQLVPSPPRSEELLGRIRSEPAPPVQPR